MKLYYATPSIAHAAVMLVKELGMDIELVEIDFASAQQRSDDYLALNPLGRVPLLVTEHGNLTETPAILSYLAKMKPESGLIPSDPWQAAQAESAMSYIASTVHINWAHGRRGARWSDDEAVIEQLKVKVPENMRESLRIMKENHFVGPYVMGDQLSVVDFHLFILAGWLKFANVELSEMPWLEAHHALMEQRDSTTV